MTLFFAVGGVDIGASAVRLEGGIASLTAVADGSVATAGVEVDDPTGALSFIDLQSFTVTETDCTTQPRCFTGYIYNLRIKRGPFRTTGGRVWVFDVGDLNFLLHLRTLRGATAKRPRETINARITWLLTTAGMTGVVFDDGLVGSRPGEYVDETDYRHQYADEVLQDVATGWIFFVRWNATNSRPELFFNSPTAAVNTSTLTISNVQSDVDNITCFAPNEDSELVGAGEAIYDGVDYTFIGDANIYRQRVSTFTAFGLHRDGTVTSSRVGKLTTAEAQAQTYLDIHNNQIDTITCTVQLPSSKVNLIDAGMRISVRFSHLPGYTSFTYTRVVSRTLTLSAGTNQFYDVQLEMSVKGIGQLSGGAPGDFPHVTSCTDAGTVVQVSTGVIDHAGDKYVTWATAVTPGNTLVFFSANRGTAPVNPDDTDWTLTPQGTFTGGWVVGPSVGLDPAKVWYRIAKSTDSNEIRLPNQFSIDGMIELSGGLTLDTSAKNTGTGSAVTCASITPTAGATAAIMGFVVHQENTATGANFTPGAGWTELADNSDPAGHPNVTVLYRRVLSTSGSYAPTTTFAWSGTPGYATQTVAFICSAGDSPPAPAQWKYNETVTMSGANGTTAFAFADGSLSVFVDNIDQTAAITSYDGVAKTFTLAFAPRPFETVLVQYQGR